MVKDKKKAKQAILGELESIRTLLENDGDSTSASSSRNLADDDVDDAPLLTEAIESVDSTPTLNDPITDQNSDQSTTAMSEKDIDTEDIETLYSEIYQSLQKKSKAEEGGDLDELEVEADLDTENPDLVDLEFQDIPTLDTVFDNKEPAHAAGLNNAESIDNELIDDVDEDDTVLETEETIHEAAVETSNQEPSSSLFDLDWGDEEHHEERVESEDEDAQLENTEQKIAELEADIFREGDDDTAPSPPAPETKKSEPDEDIAEQQHSLFADDGDLDFTTEYPRPSATHETITRKSATTESDAKPVAKPAMKPLENYSSTSPIHTGSQSSNIKTDNPFLPKHIRDRLQSNRNASDAFNRAPTPSTAKSAVAPADAVEKRADHHGKSREAELVDQLVKSYLPKIEAELRSKLLEIVRAQDKDKND